MHLTPTAEAAGQEPTSKQARTLPDDGGYYAIKGFLYQFDKTIIETLRNPRKIIRFEHRQDIDYEDFVLQVKHKETQQFSPSKIRKTVGKLIEFFMLDAPRKLLLYCHFKDTAPHDRTLTLAELDSLIGAEASSCYPQAIREQFIGSFTIRFSADYESQFAQTLDLIKSSFSLPDGETALLYHTIFRSKLLELSLRPKRCRKVTIKDLKLFLDDAEVRLFEGAYLKYLSAEKYVRLIKKTYFTFAAPNIENFERLFLVDCDSAVGLSNLVKIAARLARKFYKKGKSPQPYIVFRNLPEGHLKKLKQSLLDHRIDFFDGTHFDGDRFRLGELVGKPVTNREFTLKVVPAHQTQALIQKVPMREVFQFFLRDPMHLNVAGDHRRIQVRRLQQILQIIS